jgi:two-component system response regulator AgrA
MVEFLMLEPNRERAELFRTDMKELFVRKKCAYSLSIFFACESVLDALEKDGAKYSVVIIPLDKESDAASIASSVRKRSLRAAIIFLGNDYETLSHLLRFRPSALLPFDADKESVMQAMFCFYKEQNSYQRQREKDRYFLVRNRGDLERIPYEHIDYFESSNRKVYLHNNRDNRVYEFNAKIDDVASSIAIPGFVRCHQSLLVNLANVRRIDKLARQFIMFSGKTVDIAKRSVGDAATEFENYIIAHR